MVPNMEPNKFTLLDDHKIASKKDRILLERSPQSSNRWAVVYEKDEIRQKKKLSISLWAVIAVLSFALLFAILFGGETLLRIIAMWWPKS